MGTPKPTGYYCQPAGNQPWGNQTVHIHLNRCTIETPLTHLPILKAKKQGPDHRTDCVLQIRNQLNRQHRKTPPAPLAQKPSDGNPLLVKFGKQLDGIPKVWKDLSVAVYTAADRTHWANNGEKIDMAGKIGFFIFPNRFKSVIVG
jgi:hypothetical protein